MDLGTVKSKLKKSQYRSKEESVKDISLVWENCKFYNAENSEIYRSADRMDKYFKKKFTKYFGNQAATTKRRVG
jgi:histone acetyltransferase